MSGYPCCKKFPGNHDPIHHHQFSYCIHTCTGYPGSPGTLKTNSESVNSRSDISADIHVKKIKHSPLHLPKVKVPDIANLRIFLQGYQDMIIFHSFFRHKVIRHCNGFAALLLQKTGSFPAVYVKSSPPLF